VRSGAFWVERLIPACCSPIAMAKSVVKVNSAVYLLFRQVHVESISPKHLGGISERH